MTAIVALIKREYLEHRAAFVYVPTALLTGLTLCISYGILTTTKCGELSAAEVRGGIHFYRAGIAGVAAGWTAYLLIGLVFYFADSFSADRRNNTLLFWKSMPQSDLVVLSSKILAGLLLFPALIAGFLLASTVLLYVLMLLASFRCSLVEPPGVLLVLSSVLQTSVVGTVFLFLSVLWYAPFLAWVAGLSTLFQRWSIPLALLLPGVVVLLERLHAGGPAMEGRPIARFLAWRFDGFLDGAEVSSSLLSGAVSNPLSLVGTMFSRIHWLHLIGGLGVVALVVYLASEYRRRRLEA